jgi:hypothetical protein
MRAQSINLSVICSSLLRLLLHRRMLPTGERASRRGKALPTKTKPRWCGVLPFSAPDGGGSGGSEPIHARLLTVSRASFAEVQRSLAGLWGNPQVACGSPRPVSHRRNVSAFQVSDLDHTVRIFALEEPRGLHRVVLSIAVGARLELRARHCVCGNGQLAGLQVPDRYAAIGFWPWMMFAAPIAMAIVSRQYCVLPSRRISNLAPRQSSSLIVVPPLPPPLPAAGYHHCIRLS